MYVSFANFINGALHNAPNGVIRPPGGRAAEASASSALPGNPSAREDILNPFPYSGPAGAIPNC
jgi:hypothetical protein